MNCFINVQGGEQSSIATESMVICSPLQIYINRCSLKINLKVTQGIIVKIVLNLLCNSQFYHKLFNCANLVQNFLTICNIVLNLSLCLFNPKHFKDLPIYFQTYYLDIWPERLHQQMVKKFRTKITKISKGLRRN